MANLNFDDNLIPEFAHYSLSDDSGVMNKCYMSVLIIHTTSEYYNNNIGNATLYIDNYFDYLSGHQFYAAWVSSGFQHKATSSTTLDYYDYQTNQTVVTDPTNPGLYLYNSDPLEILSTVTAPTKTTSSLILIIDDTSKYTINSPQPISYNSNYTIGRCFDNTLYSIIVDENNNILSIRAGANTTSNISVSTGSYLSALYSRPVIIKNEILPTTSPLAYYCYQYSTNAVPYFSRITNNLAQYSFFEALYNNIEPADIENPYQPTGGSGIGGGDGDGTPTDDDTQPDDGVPSISITNTGLISLYAPSFSELQSFGNYLWSDAFSLDTFKKLFSDPMDAILGMSIVPLNLSGVTSSLIIGNVDTGLSAPKLSQQYYTVDCGSFTVQPDINSYLDYSPYTRFSVFLPYVGFQTLDADDIMGQTLNIKYKVDVLTTALICEIRIDNHLRYSFSGTCGSSIPITAQNWGSMIQSVVSSATALVGLAVGAAAAPVTGGASLGLSAVGAAGSIAGNSLSMKPDIQKGGNLGGSPGFMGWQTPFLIRYTPRRVNSKSQQTYTGYPSLITSKLSDVHGYTEIQSINLSVSGATDSECAEIDRQLKQGVILP